MLACQSIIVFGFPCIHAKAACTGVARARAVTREKAEMREDGHMLRLRVAGAIVLNEIQSLIGRSSPASILHECRIIPAQERS